MNRRAVGDALRAQSATRKRVDAAAELGAPRARRGAPAANDGGSATAVHPSAASPVEPRAGSGSSPTSEQPDRLNPDDLRELIETFRVLELWQKETSR